MIDRETSQSPYIELNFRPNVALVSVVRRFVSDFYERTIGDPDGTSRVALATHELLENAVKYSKDGETQIRIEVGPPGVTRAVSIQLRNRTAPTHIAAIRTIIGELADAADAFTYYQELLVRKARTTNGSGLGLARICAEGEMTVTLQVDDIDRVTLEASTVVGAS